MDDVQKITSQLEYLFLNKIIEGLNQKNLNMPQAKILATDFLQLEPFTTFEDARKKIQSFIRQRAEFGFLDEFLKGFHDEQQKSQLIEKMRGHMRNGQIDAALKAAKDEHATR